MTLCPRIFISLLPIVAALGASLPDSRQNLLKLTSFCPLTLLWLLLVAPLLQVPVTKDSLVMLTSSKGSFRVPFAPKVNKGNYVVSLRPQPPAGC
eukprot:scaffold272815_cov13-Tisochrysis_lutea.AAC.1